MFGWSNPIIHGTRLLVPGHTDLAIAHTQHKRIYGLCHVIASWMILPFGEESLAHMGNSLLACWRSSDSKHNGRCHSAPAAANLTENNLGPPEPPQRSKGPLPPRRPASRYCSAIVPSPGPQPRRHLGGARGRVGDGPYSSNRLRIPRNPLVRSARSA